MSININGVSLDIKKPNLGLSNEKAAREFVSANLLQTRDKVSAFITDFGNSMNMYGCSEQDGSILMNLKERDIILSNRNMINDEIEKENKSCFSAFLSAIKMRDDITCVPIPYNIECSEKPISEMSDTELKVLEYQIKSWSLTQREKHKITPRVQEMVWERRKQLANGHQQKDPIISQPTQTLTKEQSIAATKLQTVFRRRKAQDKETVLKRTFLPQAQMEEAKSRCSPSSWSEAHLAINGKSAVYLSKESPYVYKHIQSDQAQKRLVKMEQAHEICERNGYKDLVVPEARGHGEFLVEKKLPFEQHPHEQIKLYVKNYEKFDNAVTEFMGFSCQSTLNDATDDKVFGRYDNIPLYLEDGQGKIGLIDLEYFYPYIGKVEDWLFLRCRDAVRLFPYHLDIILEAAKKIDPAIEETRDRLITERDKVLRYFSKIC